ncbi:MAG: glycosyltransferase [Muribaculum sp.]|nr:glycosyltransferase [Muribaculum sp.]
MYKRILVTSIPSWNQKTGSNTFSSLFSAFESKELANIYISGQLPDSDVCSRYFHIEEMSVIKSVLKRRLQTGHEVYSTKESKSRSLNMQKRTKRPIILLWLRELAWMLGKWKSPELNQFLEDLRPDVLVFPIESYPYFNRLNQYIIDRCKPRRVIGYLWDDNFTYKQHPHSLIFKIERFFLRRQVRKLIESCTSVLAISPKMKDECDKEFGIDSVVLTKPISNQDEFASYEVGTPIQILYTGKLIIGRDKAIVEIVQSIQEINKSGQKVILDIYTQTALSAEMRKKIDIPGCCVLHEPIPQSEVIKLQKEADVLLFVESLSDKDLTARLSFSTKLTDYFAAGKCIWAVGNEDLGPIDYIKRKDAGLVSTNVESIKGTLNQIVSDKTVIPEYAEKAFQCGIMNHNIADITRKLKTIINHNS